MFSFCRWKNKNVWDTSREPCFSLLIRVQVGTGKGWDELYPTTAEKCHVLSLSVLVSLGFQEEVLVPWLLPALPAYALFPWTSNRELSTSPQRGGRPGLSPSLLAVPFLSPLLLPTTPWGLGRVDFPLYHVLLLPQATQASWASCYQSRTPRGTHCRLNPWQVRISAAKFAVHWLCCSC